MTGQTDDAFEALLRYMRDSRGFDFTGYKRTSLMRRVRHRMDQAGHETFEEYLDVLQASSDEFAALFNTILINVTTFFRDPDAWAVPPGRSHSRPPAPARPHMTRSGCGVPVAPPDKRPTAWRCCSAEALGPDEYRHGSRSMPPTSTRMR